MVRQTEASGPPTTSTPGQSGLGTLKQGFLESSNVQMVNELMRLQVAERNYCAFKKVLESLGYIVP